MEGPGPLVVNIIVNYCCTRKMLQKPEAEETKGLFVTFLSLVAFQLEGPWSSAPMAHMLKTSGLGAFKQCDLILGLLGLLSYHIVLLFSFSTSQRNSAVFEPMTGIFEDL